MKFTGDFKKGYSSDPSHHMNKIKWNLRSIYWCGYWVFVVIIAIASSGPGSDLILSISAAIFYAFLWPLIIFAIFCAFFWP